MPLYEYLCTPCNKPFEALVSIRHEGPVPCPDCGSDQVTKQLSTFAARVADGGGAYHSCSGGSGCSGCSSGNCGNCGCK